VGTVRVTASTLNVRQDPIDDARVLTQVKRGTELAVLVAGDSWTGVRLSDGTTGWVASRFVSGDGEKRAAPRPPAKRKAAPRRGSCPPDSEYAFLETPTLSFSDVQAHGLVVVEATVNTQGTVTSTKVISNTTGEKSLASLAEREIQSAKFSAPIRNCVARSFIFTYRRTF
jgi:outer membrane biosynthesis protein TonB